MFFKELERDGFAVSANGVTETEIAELCRELSGGARTRSRAGARHILKEPNVGALARSVQLMTLARAVLGPAAFPFRATYFDKNTTANWHVAWHQDTALPLIAKREAPGWGPWSEKAGVVYAHAPATALRSVLALRVHLDDSTKDNGPIRFLPGTHTDGVLSDAKIDEITARSTPVSALTPRGGIIAMRPLILHSSPKMQSDKPRRVVHIEYAASADLGDGLRLAVV